MAVDLQDLNPEFSSRMNRLIAAANEQGIRANVISGGRTQEDQRQLQANYLAGRAGKPLPYPERGRVPLAAPPGGSLHEYGLAADIQAADPKQQAMLRALAPQFGLGTIGAADPNHFQMAGDPHQLMRQYAMIGSGSPAPQPITAGTSINTTSPLAGSHSKFITDYAKSIGLDPNLALGIANAEGLKAWSASNPNAASYVDRQSGQPFSFGDFQLNIHPGALGAKALAAGIDPRDPNQWQAADRFALDQMKAGGVAPWKGDPVAANYLKTGAAAPVAGTTGVIDPTIQAGGPGAGAATPAPTGIGAAVAALTGKTGQDGQDGQDSKDGKDPSPLDQLQKATHPDPAKAAPADPNALQEQMAAMAGNQRSQQIAAQAQQLAALVQQKATQPLTWGSSPYGSNTGLQRQVPGVTLNSTGGFYG